MIIFHESEATAVTNAADNGSPQEIGIPMSIDGSAQHENNLEKRDDRLTSRSQQSAGAAVEPTNKNHTSVAAHSWASVSKKSSTFCRT